MTATFKKNTDMPVKGSNGRIWFLLNSTEVKERKERGEREREIERERERGREGENKWSGITPKHYARASSAAVNDDPN